MTSEFEGPDPDLEADFEIEIYEDVPATLEEYVRLGTLGRFDEAKIVFESCLKSHTNWFPVAAEHAELLYQQGDYKALSLFTGEVLSQQHQGEDNLGSTLNEEEASLFRLMQTLSNVHKDGSDISGFEKAIQLVKTVSQSSVMMVEYDSLSDIQARALVLQMRIIDAVRRQQPAIMDQKEPSLPAYAAKLRDEARSWFSTLQKAHLWKIEDIVRFAARQTLPSPFTLYQAISGFLEVHSNQDIPTILAQIYTAITFAECFRVGRVSGKSSGQTLTVARSQSLSTDDDLSVATAVKFKIGELLLTLKNADGDYMIEDFERSRVSTRIRLLEIDELALQDASVVDVEAQLKQVQAHADANKDETLREEVLRRLSYISPPSYDSDPARNAKLMAFSNVSVLSDIYSRLNVPSKSTIPMKEWTRSIRRRFSGFSFPGSFPEELSVDYHLEPQGAAHPDDKLTKRVLFLGHTGTGKSTTIRTITGARLEASTNLQPCTSKICSAESDFDGDQIECIDTPGFGDDRMEPWDVLEMIETYLARFLKRGRQLDAVIYLINIKDNRVDGSSLRNLEVFSDMLGDNAWNRTAFVFTNGTPDSREPSVYLQRERERESERRNQYRTTYLKHALDNGARSFDLFLSQDPYDRSGFIPADGEQARTIMRSMLEDSTKVILQCQAEMCYKGLKASETAAGMQYEQQTARRSEEAKKKKEKVDEDVRRLKQREKQLQEEREEHERQEAEWKQQREAQAERETERLAIMAKREEFLREKEKEDMEREQKIRNAAEALEEKRMQAEREKERLAIIAERETLLRDKEKEDMEREQRTRNAAKAAEKEKQNKIRLEAKMEEQRLKEKEYERLQDELRKINEDKNWTPRVVLLNNSEVTVHIRVFASPGHIVLNYANNVDPKSTVVFTLPTGFYSFDACLAGHKSSEFTTAREIGKSLTKVAVIGGAIVAGFVTGGVGGAVVAKLAGVATAGAEVAAVEAAIITVGAASGTAGSIWGADKARQGYTSVSSEMSLGAPIDLQVAHDVEDPDVLRLFQTMEKALEGKHGQDLQTNRTGFWVGFGATKLELSGGPRKISHNGRSCYVFDHNTQPMRLGSVGSYTL